MPRHPRRLLLVPQVDPAEQVRETVVVNLTGMRDRGSLRDACVASVNYVGRGIIDKIKDICQKVNH